MIRSVNWLLSVGLDQIAFPGERVINALRALQVAADDLYATSRFDAGDVPGADLRRPIIKVGASI